MPNDTTSGGSPRRIRGVNISLRILRELQELERAGVTELAAALGHSKSTIHSHLVTLEDNEFVVKEDGRYRLSLRILDIAEDVRHQIGNYDVIQEELDTLAEETGEIVQFGLEEHGQVSYLYKAIGERGVQTASNVGKRAPIHSTALGKAILAYMPEEKVDKIIAERGLEKQTSKTIGTEAELKAALQEVREQGYAVDDEENILGLRCVAAPVKNDEQILGAVSISGPSSRVQGTRLTEDFPEFVQRAANVIELNTKFS